MESKDIVMHSMEELISFLHGDISKKIINLEIEFVKKEDDQNDR